MKKLLSIVLVLTIVLSLSVTAIAAETGSITITNATIGQTYNLYKFFDATYAADANGNPTLDSDGNPIVSYTMALDPTNPLFTAMFGADGKTENPYFNYDINTYAVTKKGSASDKDIIAYLDGLASAVEPDASIPATSDEVVFSGLSTGYYLIDRGVTSTVTITTNMPDISIIDKNQIPGTNFDKLIVADGAKVDSDFANIGDEIAFEISFAATNYDGEEMIKYYTIHDVKSSALWVEFDDVAVSVGGDELANGYYFFAGPVGSEAETGEWNYLGTWTEGDPSDADWYLIHYGYDEFDIIIPWLDDYTFSCNDENNTFELIFDLDENDENTVLSESMYDANTNVVVTYTAAVGPDAVNGTVINEANLTWEHTDGSAGNDDTEKTEIKVHNLGITKIANDSAKSRLAGAIFELYRDADCTVPVYVIPTGVDGVYILDDIDTVVSGDKRISSREAYAGDALNAWLAADPNPDADGTNRRNDMVTPANGQIVVLGLNDGTYYLKETEAPAGYNKLSLPVEIEVGGTAVSTYETGYQVYGTTVVNNRGVELPATGGEGTFWLITIGTIMVIGFAVFLITHKKMSVYTD